MPTDDDRRVPYAAPPPPVPARAFASVRDDLMRLASAGSSGLTRARTERAVRELAVEAYALGKEAALTPASVAAWLESCPASWSRDNKDTLAVDRVLALLRRQ